MPFCAYCGTPVDAVSYAPCPQCGNPRNGAPRTAAKAGGGNTAAILIIVVVGGLVAVAIVGIVAAIAIPNLITATQRAKQKRTMADVRTVGTALESYAADHKQYPAVSDINGLSGELAPTYIRTVPARDGWTHSMRYESWSSDGKAVDSYVIASGGKDGAFDRALREYPKGTATTNFNDDIVYSNGAFVQYPEGVQK